MITQRDIKWMKWGIAGAHVFSTCSRRQYMAIIVDQHDHVVGTGYNGVPKGFQHCTDGGCPRASSGSAHGSGYDDCLAVHAEANALLHSDYTSRVDGVTLYINGPPCWDCAKLMTNAGISRLVYIADPAYQDWPKVEELLAKAGIEMEEMDGTLL